MPLARVRRAQRPVDYWPGFVDALTTMLLVITFLLSVFMLAQFFLAREVSGKDTVLSKLNRQIAELTAQLALAQMNKSDAENQVTALSATLASEQKQNAALQGEIAAAGAGTGSADARVAAAEQALKAEKDVSAQALAQVEILNQQIGALRRQLAAIEDALAASESRDKESQAKIADLGSRLNIALAQKVQELARYRSDFFGRLRQILGDRPDIRTVGDRFVFQSEVLFDTGKAELNPEGKTDLDKLADAVVELNKEIPPEIPWVLRVDGHTDKRPIQSTEFHSNWDLSASRAIAVVQYLVSKGVPPDRLVAAGFGEFQPIDPGDSDDAYAKNRRIELKLTEK
jgi:chemotaxis protein MotB